MSAKYNYRKTDDPVLKAYYAEQAKRYNAAYKERLKMDPEAWSARLRVNAAKQKVYRAKLTGKQGHVAALSEDREETPPFSGWIYKSLTVEGDAKLKASKGE